MGPLQVVAFPDASYTMVNGLADEPEIVTDGSVGVEDARIRPPVLPDERAGRRGVVDDVHADELNFPLEAPRLSRQPRSLCIARTTPRRPDVHHHRLAFQTFQQLFELSGAEEGKRGRARRESNRADRSPTMRCWSVRARHQNGHGQRRRHQEPPRPSHPRHRSTIVDDTRGLRGAISMTVQGPML